MVCGAPGIDRGSVSFPFLLSPALFQIGTHNGARVNRTVKGTLMNADHEDKKEGFKGSNDSMNGIEEKESMKKELKFFDNPQKNKRFAVIFFISLVVILIVDLFIHKHAEFHWTGIPEFYALFGFISCVLLIFIAKILRMIIKRDENYYD